MRNLLSIVALAAIAATMQPSAQTPHIVDMAGSRHILALWSDGTVTGMGDNRHGQLARPRTATLTFEPPAPIELPGKAIQVMASIDTSYAVLEDGTLWAWGLGASGELGVPLPKGVDARHTPTRVASLSNVVSVSAKEHEAMAVLADGTVRAWGKPPAILAKGRRVDLGIPEPFIVDGLADVVRVDSGSLHGVALTRDGRVLTWGRNHMAQLGLGQTSANEPPTMIPTLSDVTSVIRVGGAGVAVTRDGRVWTWGHNGQAGLGNGERADTMDPGQPTPQPVAGITDAVEVKAGSELGRQIIARRKNGTLIAWGNTDWGQLGTGGVAFQPRPTPITLKDVVGYWPFGIQTFARTGDGTMWFWGDNFTGLPLAGLKQNQRAPARVALERLRPAVP